MAKRRKKRTKEKCFGVCVHKGRLSWGCSIEVFPVKMIYQNWKTSAMGGKGQRKQITYFRFRHSVRKVPHGGASGASSLILSLSISPHPLRSIPQKTTLTHPISSFINFFACEFDTCAFFRPSQLIHFIENGQGECLQVLLSGMLILNLILTTLFRKNISNPRRKQLIGEEFPSWEKWLIIPWSFLPRAIYPVASTLFVFLCIYFTCHCRWFVYPELSSGLTLRHRPVFLFLRVSS